MKHYYIKYPRNFCNEYSLCWVFAGSEEEKMAIENGYERISLKDAINKCVMEKWRRKHDQAFSGYGDSAILPYKAIREHLDIYTEKYTTKDGYVYA